MRSLAILSLVVALAGCATGGSLASSPAPEPGLPSLDEILNGIQHHLLFQWAEEDADRTVTWVLRGGDPQRPLDALDQQLALQCPTVVKLAVEDFQAKVDRLRALHAQVERDRGLPEAGSNPYLIYQLTVFKWGAGMANPAFQFVQVRADILRRINAVRSGCRGLVPVLDLDALGSLVEKLAVSRP